MWKFSSLPRPSGLAYISGGRGIFLHLLIEKEANPTLWVCHPAGSESPCIQPVARNMWATPGRYVLTSTHILWAPTRAHTHKVGTPHCVSRLDERRTISRTRCQSVSCSGYSLGGGRKKEQLSLLQSPVNIALLLGPRLPCTRESMVSLGFRKFPEAHRHRY